MQYYFSIDGTNQQGPVDADGLRAAGVTPATMVWSEGMTDWQPAGTVPALAHLFPVGSGPMATPPVAPPPPFGQPSPGRPSPYGNEPPVGPNSGTNGYAIASLICGICGLIGFCCCPAIVASILAVVFGHLARGQIRQGRGSGDQLALVGLILGYVGIALMVLGMGISLSNHGFNSTGPNFNWKFGPRP
ncbi:MAG: DUF4190 domain-containing protein [Tepidisphaeraceae bacterium]